LCSKNHPLSYAYQAARLMSHRSLPPCTKYTNIMRIHPANDPKYSGIPIVRTRSAGKSSECRYKYTTLQYLRHCMKNHTVLRTSRLYNNMSSPHIRQRYHVPWQCSGSPHSTVVRYATLHLARAASQPASIYKNRNRTRTVDETMEHEIMNLWSVLIIRDKDRAGRTMARGR